MTYWSYKTASTKPEFTDVMKSWLEKYLRGQYSKDYHICVLIPNSHLSKIAIDDVKKIDNYSSFEFAPDILGLLIPKISTEKPKLIFMNRSVSAISLKEIGELYCYSKLANPFLAFIVSPKGLSNEVNFLLLNKGIEKNLLNYYDDKFIITFRWDENAKKIDKKSIFPIEKQNEF